MADLQDIAMQAAEALQMGHIKHHPSAAHDLAPSTAADQKQRVELHLGDDDEEIDSDIEEDEIPVSLLRPTPRKPQMPPLPDMRFEQSYLTSIKQANGWQAVAYITIRDQVFMPLIQGMAWTLIVAGWRHWNTATRFSGQSTGARIRRWWWGVNNWPLPDENRGILRGGRVSQARSR